MKRAATSIAAGARENGKQKTSQKTGKQKRGRRNAAYFFFRFTVLSGCAGNEGARRHRKSFSHRL